MGLKDQYNPLHTTNVYLMVPEGANSSSATAAVSRREDKRGWNKAPSCAGATTKMLPSMLS